MHSEQKKIGLDLGSWSVTWLGNTGNPTLDLEQINAAGHVNSIYCFPISNCSQMHESPNLGFRVSLL